jgi:DNA-binding ferritin-like protein (Dps family)
MDLARKLRQALAEDYDAAYKELQDALYHELAEQPSLRLMDMQALQKLYFSAHQELVHRVCGDPTKGVGLTIPSSAVQNGNNDAA